MVYSESFHESKVLSQREFGDTPIFEFEGRLNRSVFISDIVLGFDAAFTQWGLVKIEINDIPFFDSAAQLGDFTRYNLYPVGTGNKILRQGEKIRIFAKNAVNSDDIKLSVSFSLSAEPFTAIKNPDASNQLDINRLLSTNPEVSTDTRAITDALQSVQDAIESAEGNSQIIAALDTLRTAINNTAPDNTQILTALSDLRTAVESGDNSDIVAGLTTLTNAVNNNAPDNTAIVEGLNNVRTALRPLTDDTLKISSNIDAIINEEQGENIPITYEAALVEIRLALSTAQTDFSQDSLDALISAIRDNILIIRSNNPILAASLEVALTELLRIHETVPFVRSDSQALFPRRIYHEETHTALLDLAGHDDFIILVNTYPRESITVNFEPSPRNIPAFHIAEFVEEIFANFHHATYGNSHILSEASSYGPLGSIQLPFSYLHTYDYTLPYPDLTTKTFDIRITPPPIPRINEINKYDVLHPIYYTVNYLTWYEPIISRSLNVLEATLNPNGFFSYSLLRSHHNLTDTIIIPNLESRTGRVRVVETVTITGIRYRTMRIPGRHSDQMPYVETESPLPAIDINTFDIPNLDISIDVLNGDMARGQLTLELRDSLGAWHRYADNMELLGVPEIDRSFSNLIAQYSERNANRLLPSSNSLLRLRLDTLGGLETAIDIIRIS